MAVDIAAGLACCHYMRGITTTTTINSINDNDHAVYYFSRHSYMYSTPTDFPQVTRFYMYTYLQSYNLIKILTSSIAGNYMILLLSPDSNLNILTIRILNSYVVSDLAGILPTYTDLAMYVLTTITFVAVKIFSYRIG